MNGQLVIVKDVAHRPLLRKVCYANQKTVFVTSENAFDAIKKGNSGLFPIGFRAENVFIYDGQDLTGKINWEKLKRWRE
ncbi:MAG TPA: hypothetical protein VMD27_02585 [Candidatus Aquilonibacter sp.]|nr:hypothetical protein [Candidatus Aquilonibacter sp.]